MISREFCKEQISRMYQLKGYPKVNRETGNEAEVKRALGELVDALQCASNEEKAKGVIDGFMRDTGVRECPLAADIRRAAYATVQSQEEWSRPPEWTAPTDLCKECDSWGFLLRDERYERCSCPNGVALEQNILDSLNRTPAKEPPGPFRGTKPITAEDILRQREAAGRR